MIRFRPTLLATLFVAGCMSGTSLPEEPPTSDTPSNGAASDTPSGADSGSSVGSRGLAPRVLGDRRMTTAAQGFIVGAGRGSDPRQPTTPDVPTTPEDPGTPSTPEVPSTPDVPEDPGTPATPDTSNIDWNVATGKPVTTSPAVAGTSFTAGSNKDVFVFAVNGTGNNRGITNTSQVRAGFANAAKNAGIFVLTNLYQTKPDLLTYALDNVTGASFSKGGMVVNMAGSKVYALSAQGTLYCFAIPAGGPVTGAATRANACTGWTNYSGAAATYSSPWPVYDGTGNVTKIYFGDDSGVLHCVNGATGASCWAGGGGALATPTTAPLASPIAYDGVVYVGDNVGRFFRVVDAGATPNAADANTASWDLCGSAPGTCAATPWGIQTSPTIDVVYEKAYVASGGRIFEFPVGAGKNWQPAKPAKILVASATKNIVSNPVLDPDGTNWLYVGYNNSIYKVRYPFDGSTTTGVYATTLQRTVSGDASYPRGTPLAYNGVVYMGSGNGSTGIGEQYGCGGASDMSAPALIGQTAVSYEDYVQSPMVVDYVTGNVNFGYGAGTSSGGAVQYKSSGSPDWACPSGYVSIAGGACGAAASCASRCTVASQCPGTNQSSKTCSGGICGGTCSAGFADCNNDKNSDGCETNTKTDVNNCGGCGTTCSTNNVTPSCTNGACGGTCDAGFANCNGNAADGCEAAVSCGDCCGVTCGAGKACVGGTCTTSTYSSCVLVSEHQIASLSCPAGTKITSITFASYGTPNGSCGSFTTSTCNASTSVAKVSAACVGKTSCTVPAENDVFGDPCVNTFKRLYVQVACGC